MSLQSLIDLLTPRRRKVFVSYHHSGDRYYYSEFSRVFHDSYEAIHDSSVDRRIDSDDAEYVMGRIRNQYICGTSCTVVLCGAATRWRKYVDWEIKASLDRQNGLLGVYLPAGPMGILGIGRSPVPDRLQDNIDSGYACMLQWSDLAAGRDILRLSIEDANRRSKGLIENGRDLRHRNGPTAEQSY